MEHKRRTYHHELDLLRDDHGQLAPHDRDFGPLEVVLSGSVSSRLYILELCPGSVVCLACSIVPAPTYPEADGSFLLPGQLAGERVAGWVRHVSSVGGGHGDVERDDVVVDWGRSAPVCILGNDLERRSLNTTFIMT